VLARVVYTLNDQNRFRLTYDHLDRDTDWTVLSAIAKPPLASTSVLGLTAFDKMKRDRVSLDHRFTGGQGLIRRPRPRSTTRKAPPGSIRPRTATPPPTAPATPPSTTKCSARRWNCTARRRSAA
jgi:hypothetical protein